ncbi:MAG: carbohydrate-binding family V/XII, partial [Gammaproteobacteria bacterium]
MKRYAICLLGLMTMLMLLVSPASAEDAEQQWPRVLKGETHTITMYQPQLDTWKDSAFESRAAVSVKEGEGAPVFGAVFISGRFEVDRDTRMVHFSDIKVPTVAFPEASEEDQQELKTYLESEFPKWNLSISLDRVLPMLETAELDESSEVKLKNTPPEIIVKHEPAVLIIIDGEPKLQDIDDSKLERVVNTPNVIVKYKEKTFYLAADTLWYKASDIMGPWKTTTRLPKDVDKIDEALKKQRAEEEKPAAEASEEKPDSREPTLVVTKVPAELIFIDGEPELAPVKGTDILLVSNTDSDVMFDIASQNYYVLLSGRWFSSKDIDKGPWTFVPSDEVPTPFEDIPADSEVGYVRSSVAGTEEAREALLEQAVPQTAAVKPTAGASFKVEYDGSPNFAAVEGTAMKYAVNTGAAVILSGGRYYCCDQGIWYESASPTGAWTVCKKVPDEIYTIPPSNPHYNITYVKIYDSTPEVVYVGYTPGYTGSYVSNGCVVYGTGYYYRPYWSPTRYYPYHSTWGFHVRWNPWYGWSCGLSYSNGPFRITVGWGGYGGFHRGGFWGPMPYRPYPRYGYGAGYRAGYRHGYRHGYNSGRHHGGSRPPNAGHTRPNNNIYARPSNSARVANTQNRNRGQQPK